MSDKQPNLTPSEIVWGAFYHTLFQEAARLRALLKAKAASEVGSEAESLAAGSPLSEAKQQVDSKPALVGAQT